MLAAKLFGLEESVLEKCPSGERNGFSLLAAAFLVLLAMCFLSLLYLFQLLFGSYWMAMPVSVLIGFVYFCILRFSIISIGVPYSDTLTFGKLILNSGNITRLVIFSSFVFSICVPFVSFFYHDEITPQIDMFKSDITERYRASKLGSKQQQLNYLYEAIEIKKNELILIERKSGQGTKEQNALRSFQAKKIRKNLNELRLELNKEDLLLSTKIDREVSEYSKELKHTEMPFMRFRYVLSIPDSALLITLSFLAFMCLIPVYIYMLVGKNFYYSKKVHLQTSNLIQLNYSQASADIQNYLKNKFKYTRELNSAYADPPFNTIPVLSAVEKIKDQDIFSYFDKLNNGNGAANVE